MNNRISFFKTLVFNFYYLPFSYAIKLPIRVSKDTKICNLGSRTSVSIENKSQKIAIGYGSSFALGNTTSWTIEKKGKIKFRGDATIGRGTQIIVNNNAILEFGNNFFCNANCIINSGNNIIFGDDCLLGWNVEILDGDGHIIISQGINSKYFPIIINNHVWIGANTMILKGVEIKSGCIVAAKSCVTKSSNEENCIIKDNNIVKRNIRWEK